MLNTELFRMSKVSKSTVITWSGINWPYNHDQYY